MRIRYVGPSFGAFSLTEGKIYEAVVENGMYRVIDDSDEDYLYSMTEPGPLDGSVPGGRWEVVDQTDDPALLEKLRRLKSEYDELMRQ